MLQNKLALFIIKQVKKYNLKYKDIICDNDNLLGIFQKTFKGLGKYSFTFLGNKKITHKCQIDIYKFDNEYLFGRFGEIKNSDVENGVAIYNEKEINNAEFKYHVQFLIKISTHEMDFIYNSKASCFEEAFVHFISVSANTVIFNLVNKDDYGLRKRIQKAKKIRYISVKKNNSDEINGLCKDFFEFSSYDVLVKIKFKNKSSFNNDKMVEFYESHKNDQLLSVGLIDEYNNSVVRNFAEDLFFKTKTIVISPSDIKNNDFIFEKLLENLENYDA